MVTTEAVVAPDSVAAAWRVLRDVMDPEIPVLSIVDLGIVRFVRMGRGAGGSDELHVGLTPTYSGCPATEVIRASVVRALNRAGFSPVKIENVLSPPWTSEWITAEGRRRLLSFGIAPPVAPVSNPRRLFGDIAVPCPRCGSEATERISEFGSTPCKAHYRCTECLEPFDYFKCI
jgi:ring-1,2-phenylacetyl-CoA epoxidase subunit PaaD